MSNVEILAKRLGLSRVCCARKVRVDRCTAAANRESLRFSSMSKPTPLKVNIRAIKNQSRSANGKEMSRGLLIRCSHFAVCAATNPLCTEQSGRVPLA